MAGERVCRSCSRALNTHKQTSCHGMRLHADTVNGVAVFMQHIRGHMCWYVFEAVHLPAKEHVRPICKAPACACMTVPGNCLSASWHLLQFETRPSTS